MSGSIPMLFGTSLLAAEETPAVSTEMICLIVVIFLCFFIIALMLMLPKSLESKTALQNKNDSKQLLNEISRMGNRLSGMLQKLEAVVPNTHNNSVSSQIEAGEFSSLRTNIINTKNSISGELREFRNEMDNFRHEMRSHLAQDEESRSAAEQIEELQKSKADLERVNHEMSKQLEDIAQNNVAEMNKFVNHIIPDEVTNLFTDIEGFGETDCDPKLLDLYFATISLHHKAESRDKEELRKGFIAFDGILYDYFKNNLDSLTALRERFTTVLNEDYLKGYFIVEWPAPGDIYDPSKHKSRVSSGNRIKFAESAVICNSEGQVLLPARVETRR